MLDYQKHLALIPETLAQIQHIPTKVFGVDTRYHWA